MAAGERRHLTVALRLSRPRLWSPKEPHLYPLTTRVLAAGRADVVATRIGVRRLAFEDGRFLLNGEPLRLRGVNRHQEYPYAGYAMSRQADYRDALLIRKYGFDYLRLSHYPHSPAFMAAAGGLGVPVAAGDLVFVRARLLDAKGTTVPVSGREVAFSGGPGTEIVGSPAATTEAGIASVPVRVQGPRVDLSAQAGPLRGRLARGRPEQ